MPCPGVAKFRIILCVQLRLVCSVGGSPTRVRARSPIAWIAEGRETKSLKPIDKVTRGVMSESPGRNESERTGGLESSKSWKLNLQPRGESKMSKRKLADTFVSFQRGNSDSMVARTYRATGEALLVPGRNSWRKVSSITSKHWEMSLRREGCGWACSSYEPE